MSEQENEPTQEPTQEPTPVVQEPTPVVQEPTPVVDDSPHVTAQTAGVPAEEPASGAPDVSGLTLQAHRLEDHGYWSFGVTLNGRYVELAACKLGLADPVAPSE